MEQRYWNGEPVSENVYKELQNLVEQRIELRDRNEKLASLLSLVLFVHGNCIYEECYYDSREARAGGPKTAQTWVHSDKCPAKGYV